ncbi:MAG TPA: dihydrofolate reductase [bacterium]|nr:dihydrofolate reductase [bacterium]
MTLEIIVAMDEDGVIGRAGGLPWHLPADLRHFRRTTTGYPVIMGRRTWESVGKPLPKRTSIVVTSRDDLPLPGEVLRARSLDEAVELAERTGADRAFVVGGAGLYREALGRADRLHLTRVHGRVDGDVRFPEFDEADWKLLEERSHPADGKHAWALSFRTYARR